MRYPFAKYQGLGNDFIVLDARQWPEARITPTLAQQLCDRHRAIGGDGILWVEPRGDGSARLVIYNQDGSRPEMCGNGVRCVAAYLADREELTPGQTLALETDAGPRPIELSTIAHDGSWLSAVSMGTLVADAQPFAQLELDGHPLGVHFADAGNPHAVLFVPDVLDDSPARTARREQLAAAVRAHRDRYPHGTNVEFVGIDSSGVLRTRVHERGVGWTLACGTGACAVAAVHAARTDAREASATVELDGGRLLITLQREAAGRYHTRMAGPARRCFRGSLEPHEIPQ
jgi:diaminopimelate epimerase